MSREVIYSSFGPVTFSAQRTTSRVASTCFLIQLVGNPRQLRLKCVEEKTGNKNMLSVPENCWKQDCRTVKKTRRDWLVNLKMGLDGIHPELNKGQEVNFQTQSQDVFIQPTPVACRMKTDMQNLNSLTWNLRTKTSVRKELMISDFSLHLCYLWKLTQYVCWMIQLSICSPLRLILWFNFKGNI